MTVLKILTSEDKLLRKKSKAINKITPEIKKLADDMFETLYSSNERVGVAAPQVGHLKQMVVIDVSKNRDCPVLLINPKIISSKGEVLSTESCLSVPGVEGTVKRKETIIVRSRNINDEMIEFEAGGFFAICIQHELDHLKGVLFIDKLVPDHEKKKIKEL